MEVSIDSYAQMRVMLSSQDISILEKEKRIDGKIWRSNAPDSSTTLPCVIYLQDKRDIRVFSLPSKRPWEEKNAYLVRLNSGAVGAIKEGKYVGLGTTPISLRSVLMSLDTVF